MVLKNSKYVLLLMLIPGCIAFGAARVNDVPAVSKGDILFYTDYSVFRGSEEKNNYVEFYLMLFSDQLEENNNKFSLSINSVITDRSEKVIKRKQWITDASISSETEKRTMAVYDQWNENLSPGNYSVKVSVQDVNSGKRGEAIHEFSVDEFTEQQLTSSMIEFATMIETAGINDHFSKGNKKVIPNPSRRYGILNPILYIYYELYNLEVDKEDSLNVKYSVISKLDQKTKNYPPVKISKKLAATAVTHGLNAGNLSSGIYDLEIVVSDEKKEIKISRQFEIIQIDFAEKRSSISVENSEFFEEILSIFGSSQQVNTYESLTPNAKASYIIQFWKSMDPVPETAENEFLQKVQQRFLYANKNFSWGKNEGWKTDRGRIVLKYGIPDEVDQQNSQPDMSPFEIWIYRQEKRFIFVFGDPQSNGRYILLHSDKEGEIYNDRWKEYLKKM